MGKGEKVVQFTIALEVVSRNRLTNLPYIYSTITDRSTHLYRL